MQNSVEQTINIDERKKCSDAWNQEPNEWIYLKSKYKSMAIKTYSDKWCAEAERLVCAMFNASVK